MISSSTRWWFTGRAPRLDQEHVPLADVLQELHERVAVGEIEHVGATQFDIERRAHIARQLRMRIPREHRRLAHIPTHRKHPRYAPTLAYEATLTHR